jgi:hypothetical protein
VRASCALRARFVRASCAPRGARPSARPARGSPSRRRGRAGCKRIVGLGAPAANKATTMSDKATTPTTTTTVGSWAPRRQWLQGRGGGSWRAPVRLAGRAAGDVVVRLRGEARSTVPCGCAAGRAVVFIAVNFGRRKWRARAAALRRAREPPREGGPARELARHLRAGGRQRKARGIGK